MNIWAIFHMWQVIIGLRWQFIFPVIHLAPYVCIDARAIVGVHMHLMQIIIAFYWAIISNASSGLFV